MNSNWSPPTLVQVIEKDDRLELVYREEKLIWLLEGETPVRVYKIIYSCKDNKFHKSGKIFGEVVPPTKESYEFDY